MLSREELLNLTTRLRRRDGQALHLLYVELFDPLQLYAFRYVYDWEEARDIVQSAFLQLWINIESLKPDSNVSSYLTSIVHNLCGNYLRHLDIVDSNREKLIEATFFQNLHSDNSTIPLEIRLKLDSALRNLPSRSYEILMAHIVEGKKNAEIAKELGIAESTVKTHLKRALRFLRGQMLMIIFIC